MNINEYNLYTKVHRSLTELTSGIEGKSFCVGFSGGADSSALISVMLTLRKKYSFTLFAAHLNHLIRGEEARLDMEFCASFCKENDIKLFAEQRDIPSIAAEKAKSVETAAREERYAFFDSLVKSENIDFILTAHNKNDNAETILHNIIRGCTVDGLRGIPPKNGYVLRPMLEATRSEIVMYLKEKELSYTEDATNNDICYTRNYLRHIVIPAMEKVNPQISDSLINLSEYAKKDIDFIDSKKKDYIKHADMPDAVMLRAVREEYKRFCGHSLLNIHTKAIMDKIKSEKNGRIYIKNKIYAVIADGNVAFSKDTPCSAERDEGTYELVPGENHFCSGKVRILLSDEEKDLNIYNIYTTMRLSFDKIKGTVKFRARLPGDRIRIGGMSRSLKKLMQEKRIVQEMRDMIPVFFDDDGIVFVPFVGVSDRYAARDSDGNNAHDIRSDERYINVIFN